MIDDLKVAQFGSDAVTSGVNQTRLTVKNGGGK